MATLCRAYYSMDEARACFKLCWLTDDFGNHLPAPDLSLLLGFIIGEWD